jgi:hypothetical protein
MGFKFFHTPRAKDYGYKPRYYDERKEELKKRMKAIDQELALEEKMGREQYYSNIKGQMRGYMRQAKKQKRKSNIRLAIILTILFVIAYLILG